VGLRRFATIAVSTMAITAASAAELPIEPPQPIAQWESEIGGRYWYSTGRTKIDLFNTPAFPAQVSRLTWTGLQAHSGEGFARLEHLTGFFIKGYAGGGAIPSGNLQDEDFPPSFLGGYSSTTSDHRDGRLAYATADLGWTMRSEGIKLGFFAGWFYNFERLNAFGCTQTASNPFICVPPIPSSVLVITQDTTWNAVRFGFNGEWRFGGAWIVNLDFALLPFAWLNATDTHALRPFSVPERGDSFRTNVQVEALLRYQFVNGFSVGVGGRYWRIDSDSAEVNFASIGGQLQSLALVSERWGGFLQASYKFGELGPTF
jgi:outer membrane protease